MFSGSTLAMFTKLRPAKQLQMTGPWTWKNLNRYLLWDPSNYQAGTDHKVDPGAVIAPYMIDA